MLVFHIGLPKTASTYLQHRVLKPAYRNSFFHRNTPSAGRNVREIRRSILNRKFCPDLLSDRTKNWLRSISAQDCAIVSDENLSSRGRDFWDGTGVSPEEVAGYLHDLQTWLDTPQDRFGVLIGIRAQDQFLASRYAQSAYQAYLKGDLNHSQADFEKRMHFILQHGDSLPALRWLYYENMRDVFTRFFGNRVFIYRMEDLQYDPLNVLNKMGSFCGITLPTPPSAANENRRETKITRKISANVWSFAEGRTLSLDNRLVGMIKSHFGKHYPTIPDGGRDHHLPADKPRRYIP